MCTDHVVAPTPAAIEAETDDYGDADSSFGSEAGSSTTSIGSSILKYRTENGRTYHSYKDGKYLVPNDDAENDRLDLQHHLFALTFDGALVVAPIPKTKTLHRALDIGTGTGIWAIDFADEHPETQVLGVDLSPIQPLFLPPNCKFEIDDVEEPWTYTEKFDLIHSRMMTGSIADWPKLIAQSFDALTPGGYLQLTDQSIPALSDDGTLLPTSALQKWCDCILEGTAEFGRNTDSAKKYKVQMEEAGFVDVVEKLFKWPMNRWPKEKKMKEMGMWNHENVSGGLSGLSMALFTRALGWSVDELEVFLMDVRKDMRDTKIHSYFLIHVVYGRKPE